MAQRFDCADPTERTQGIKAAAAALRRGALVVGPTDSAYAVACDAFNATATERLRTAKGRPADAPLPVMVGEPQVLEALVFRFPEPGRELVAAFWPGPVTIVARQQPSLAWDVDPSGNVAVRMPLHPVALSLLNEVGPLAVTGANFAGLPVPLTCGEAEEQLGDSVAVYLDAGPMSADRASAIVDVTTSPPALIRPGSLSAEQLTAVLPELQLT